MTASVTMGAVADLIPNACTGTPNSSSVHNGFFYSWTPGTGNRTQPVSMRMPPRTMAGKTKFYRSRMANFRGAPLVLANSKKRSRDTSNSENDPPNANPSKRLKLTSVEEPFAQVTNQDPTMVPPRTVAFTVAPVKATSSTLGQYTAFPVVPHPQTLPLAPHTPSAPIPVAVPVIEDPEDPNEIAEDDDNDQISPQQDIADVEDIPSPIQQSGTLSICDGILRMTPGLPDAQDALRDLTEKLKGIPHPSQGYKHENFDPFIRPRLEGMRAMLNLFVKPLSATYGKSRFRPQPFSPKLGKEISAMQLMHYMQRPDVKEKHGIMRDITERTARHYLYILGYRWKGPKKGQFVDGHEREDVVWHCDVTYLPRLLKYQERTRKWDRDNRIEFGPHLPGRRVVIWYHDETIFYAHDRRRVFWQHNSKSAKPYAKGEGASLMIANFVSADFGFLVGKDGDGYFTNIDILAQVEQAMKILQEMYPDFDHVFVYDNATTHTKHPKASISARNMTKWPSATFGVKITERDANGNPCYTMGPNGVQVLKKTKVRMSDPDFELPDHSKQTFYWETGPDAGKFKGIVQILKEQGFTDFSRSKLLECHGFKCQDTSVTSMCCCRRILFQPAGFHQC
ncbi:hypothetical protein BKA70DRAFT_1222261 [Coprinopsis sp. MPI-PUGE-AT-0042]|nr:hypothetical protein BKA70DRAFT_1222261 [Coprinopsis sp. MPI-PUGE-AT-0042]